MSPNGPTTAAVQIGMIGLAATLLVLAVLGAVGMGIARIIQEISDWRERRRYRRH